MNNIYWKNATPEQHIAWDYVYGIADALGAVAITPLFYQGAITAAEFETYSVNKLYLALQMNLAGVGASIMQSHGEWIFYDEANAINYNTENQIEVWNDTGAAYNILANDLCIKNIYFSRVAGAARAVYIKFIGYRLDITP